MDVKINMDIENADICIPVLIEIEQERFLSKEQLESLNENSNITDILVAKGLHAQWHSTNLLTGQLVEALDFFPNTSPKTLI